MPPFSPLPLRPCRATAVRDAGCAQRPRCSLVWALAGVLVALFAGCGVPGDPLPPLLEIPQPVSDLTAAQVGGNIVLRFTPPQRTTEGTLVRFLDRIEVHAAFLPPGSSPEGFPASAGVLASWSGAQLPEGAGEVSYTLPLEASQVGRLAVFGVKAINRRQVDAGFSNLASVEIADLPEPPRDLQAHLTETAIELRWTPADRSVFGGSAPLPDGYEIYRATPNSSLPPQLLATTPATSYADPTFAFGTSYFYTVRAVVRRGEFLARTPDSNRAAVAAVDRFPPAAPRNLRAVAVPGAVALSWSPNHEPDLAGYNVYRSEGGEFTRLNRAPVEVPLYRDASVPSGAAYRYLVRAVDRNGNESPPSGEAAPAIE